MDRPVHPLASRSPRSRSFRAPPSLLLPLLIAAGAALPPRDAEAVQAGDIERVRLVLGAPVVYGALPFDEPFYLSGRLDEAIDSVGAWIAPHRSGSTDAATCAGPPPRDARVGSWERVPATSFGRSIGPDSFYVRIDELPPARRFDLCVTARSRPDDETLVSLRAGWRVAIDSAFRGRPDGWTPGPDELERFRASLLSRIGPGVEPGPGSPLAAAASGGEPASTARLPERALRAVVEISSAQRERRLALEGLTDAEHRAAAALATLARHAALERLVTTWATGGGDLRSFLSAHRASLETAAALRSRTHADLVRIASGSGGLDAASIGAPAEPTTSAEPWDPQTLEPRSRSLDGTMERLGDLAALLGSLEPVEDDLGPLAAAVRDAIDALAAVRNGIAVVALELARRDRALDEAADALTAHERSTIAVETHTYYNLETSARNRVAADFGAVYLPDMDTVSPVLGANFYLRPVNRDRGPGGNLLRRFAINIGVTTASLRREGLREDLAGSLNLAVGAGLRLTRLFRLSGGVVLLRELEPGGGSDATRLALTPFVGLTLDFVVKDALGDLFGEVF